MVQAPPPQMTVLSSQAMPYPVTYPPQQGSVPPQMLPGNDYADLGERSQLQSQRCSASTKTTGGSESLLHGLTPDHRMSHN